LPRISKQGGLAGLKDSSVIKSRFKPSLLLGVLAGYAVVFLLSPVIQYLTGLVLGFKVVNLSIDFYKLTCEFYSGSGKIFTIAALLVPTFLYILNIEINSYMLTKVTAGFYRNFFIVYSMVLIGYLMVNVFIGAVIVVLKVSLTNDYAKIVNDVLGFTMPASFLIILIILILLTLYINITTKRIMKYISI
jgi:hypothetical protein